MTTTARLLGFLSLSLLIGLCNTGCRSVTQPASASFASVTIKGKTVGQIREAAAGVFRADGYKVFTVGEQLVFEKEGSRSTTIAHDGFLAAQEGAVTIVRVRADVVDLGEGSHRLQCRAFMVTGASDPFLQDEKALANIRRAPYQNLLDKVAKQLK